MLLLAHSVVLVHMQERLGQHMATAGGGDDAHAGAGVKWVGSDCGLAMVLIDFDRMDCIVVVMVDFVHRA